MKMCTKCCKMCGGILLVLGLAFLFVDLGKWDFWGLSWWTVAFLLMGLCKFAKSGCPECIKAK